MEDVVVGHDNFSRNLAKELGTKYINVKLQTFPDNEIKPILEIKSKNEIKEKNVLVVSRTNRFEPKPNDAIVELGLNVKNLSSLEVEKVDILMPYMHYARQDESFQRGEPESFSYITNLYQDWLSIGKEIPFRKANVENIITVNSHLYGKPLTIDKFFRSIRTHDLSSSGVFGEYFRKKNLKEPIVIVPGPVKLAQEFANSIGSEYEVLSKKRSHRTGKIIFEHTQTNFKNKDVIIYDDVTATGGTLAEAVNIVSETDPHRIYIALTHLISEMGVKSVCDLGVDEVVTTNSFDSGKDYKRFTELTLVPLLSGYIKRL